MSAEKSNTPTRNYETGSQNSNDELKTDNNEGNSTLKGDIFAGVEDSKKFDIGKLKFTKHENKNIVEVVINGILISKNKDDDLINVTQILDLAGLSQDEINKTLSSDITNERTEIDDGKYKGIWIKTEVAAALIKKLELEKPLQGLLKEYDVENKATLSRSLSAMTESDEHRNYGLDSPAKKFKLQESGKKDSFEMVTKYALEPMDITHIENHEQLKEIVTQIFISDQDSIHDACDQLVANHINLDLPIDAQGNTVLHWAASLANIPLVYQLVTLGATFTRGNNNGETALMRAVAHTNFLENLSFGKLLDVLYPSIVVLDNKHRTVLHHIVLTAGIEGRSDAAKYYLQCLVEWIIKNSPNKSDAITLASFMNNIVNLKDANGDTALNIVARIGNKAIARQLLDIGADPKIPNKAGLTPADFRITGLDVSNGNLVDVKDETNDQISILLNKSYASKRENSKALIEAFESHGDDDNNNNDADGAANGESNKRISLGSKKIINTMQEMMSQLNENFENELKMKQTEINHLYKELKKSTIKLTKSRSQLELLKSSESKLNELKQKTSNIEKSIQEEETNFNSQYPEARNQAFDINTVYDPDQPFKVPSVYYDVKSQLENAKASNPQSFEIDLSALTSVVNVDELPPTYVLRARIKAYKENEKYLLNLANNLDQKSVVLENKFRHVVSLCTGVEEDKVDDLLEGLVQAVESDPDEVDLGRVAGFLTKVDEDM